MRQLKVLLEYTKDFFDFKKKLDPSLSKPPVIRVFGKPNYQGGPQTKYLQLSPICAPKDNPFSTIVCLSSVRVPLFYLRILKKLGAKIVVNQNGVYYPSWAPKNYKGRNRYLKRLNNLADHSFFQSQFARDSYETWVGDLPKHRDILYNPVDLEVFYPDPNKKNDELRILIFLDISEHNFPTWKYLLGFKQFTKENLKTDRPIKWVFIGRTKSPRIARILNTNTLDNQPDIETHFDKKETEVASVLRGCDLSLHFVYNDVCPNKVLESLASGVWVVTGSSGGTPELVQNAGKVIEVKKGYDAPQFPTFQETADAIKEYEKSASKCRQAAIDRARDFSIKKWRKRIEEVATSNLSN